MTTYKFSEFVRRQTPASEFSHTSLSDEEVLARVASNWHRAKPCYRKYNPETGKDDKGLLYGGVVAVPVDPDGFVSSICTLNEGDRLVGEFAARRPGETPRQSVRVLGGVKTPACSVDVILYHRDVLAEDEPGEYPCEWEIISINASPEPEGTEVPIDPMTLMHNHFGSSGGTATGLSDSELVAKLRAGFLYWRDKAMAPKG
jgi:hypothetical protein